MRRTISKFYTIVAPALLAFAISAGNARASVTISDPSPPPPPAYTSLTNVIKVVAGSSHSLALKSDGTVWAWGYNEDGELGDGTSTTKLSPVQTLGLTNVTAIAAGYFHSLALKSDGTVWTWGWNQNGQLGDGSLVNRSSPVRVTGLTAVVAIAAGWGHSFALKSDGTVWAWGANDVGQLADGTTTQRHAPVQVLGLTGVVAIADTVALKSDGTVWAWGANDVGQVGDGTTIERHTPVQVIGLTDIKAIASGGAHYLALDNGGNVWAWGWNLAGQIGDGTTTNRLSPVRISILFGVTHIAAGALHSMIITTFGGVYTWGYNDDGELGSGSIQGSLAPVQVQLNSSSYAESVASGGFHSIAVMPDGTLKSWGWNIHGQLGDGTSTSRTRPVLAGGLSGRNIAAGYYHSLALNADGTAWAWGENSNGQLGDATTIDRSIPTQVRNLTELTAVAATQTGSYALKSDGTVWGWGIYPSGNTLPLQVSGLENVRAITAGLALKSDGTVWQIGADGFTPRQVTGLSEVIAIASKGWHFLALKADGTVWAWGLNSDGQLGNGTTVDSTIPVQVSGLNNVIAIVAGERHSLALKIDGTVWAWGINWNGQLGDGTTASRSVPVQVSLTSGVSIVNIAAGAHHSFAQGTDGSIWGWGISSAGQLGSGTTWGWISPDLIANLYGKVAVAGHWLHSFAVNPDGTVSAWGDNSFGELGDGSTTNRLAPVSVQASDGNPFSLLFTLDTTPDIFTFTPQAGVALNTSVLSNYITVSGINAPAPISIIGGEYTLDNSVTWTSVPGTVTNGMPIWVRLTSSGSFSSTTSATLTIGGVSGTFSVTTQIMDTTPDPFLTTLLVPYLSVPLHTDLSITFAVTGINAPSPISIVGGAYNIDYGTWANASGTVTNGQLVTVRVTSSSSYSTTTSATLTIGGVSGTFSVTTAGRDITPDQFSFTPVTGAPINTLVESNTVLISGINDSAPMTVTGQGEYSVNGGAWSSAPGTVVNGDSVKVRIMSSGSYLTAVDTKLVINGVQGTFSVTTMEIPDTTPDAFSFPGRTLVPTGLTITSDAITVSGINMATSISIVGGEYSIDGGAYTSASGTVTNGRIVRVRQASSSSYNTTTTTTLTIGGVSGSFSLTTAPSNAKSLHTSWWSARPGYNSYALLKNASNSAIQITPTFTTYDGTAYAGAPISLEPRKINFVYINDYVNSLGGRMNGGLELTYTGNARDVIGDLLTLGPEGFGHSAAFRDNTAGSTTISTPWWSARSGYSSYALLKNTSNSTVQVTPTFAAYDGTTYTGTPISIEPRKINFLYINDYVASLGGRMNGGLELSHTGIPGAVIADLITFGPAGFGQSAAFRDNTAGSTTISTPWWSARPGYSSYALLKNTSNSTVQVTPTFAAYDGTTYTGTPISIEPRKINFLYINDYVASLGGRMNGGLELSHTGIPGDMIADLITFGPAGFGHSAAFRDNTAGSTTIGTPWWSARPGYSSYALLKNTSNSVVQVTPTFTAYDGTTYTGAPISIEPRKINFLYINDYVPSLGGRMNGGLELTYTGNPGDVIADLITFGPDGFGHSAEVR